MERHPPAAHRPGLPPRLLHQRRQGAHPRRRAGGGELSLSWLPNAGWRLDGSLSLINAKLRTDANGLGGKAGDRIPSTPKSSATLAVTHNFQIAGNAAYT